MLQTIRKHPYKMLLSVLVTVLVVVIPMGFARALDVSTVSGISTKTDMHQLISDITAWITGIVGAIAILMLIYGGLRYVISAGNDDDIEKAKNIIMYAIIGIIVILIAFVVVKTVNDALNK